MIVKKQCVAMLLAGGQGSRLMALTSRVAKPAVRFGGKYRIIDFTLSNCVNSGIDTVGVLTQYQPLELNDYIGNGQPWDLDRMFGGVHILPPYQRSEGGDWYRGTASAVYQNLSFIGRYDPDYVLVLSGDHIYKMDYSQMLRFHKERGAQCTIAAIRVPMKERGRFGIIEADETGRILTFEEKPEAPKSDTASMGIYIFDKDTLFSYLHMDEEDARSQNDFGKNVIPRMLKDGQKMYAWRFSGYWKDVGTLESLYAANMDLLGEHPALDLSADDWRIYYKHSPSSPHYVGKNAIVRCCALAEGCEIEGEVQRSVLCSGVEVEQGARVLNSVIMENTVIRAGATVENAIVAQGVVVGHGARVGAAKENRGELTLLAEGTQVPPGSVVTPPGR